MLPDKIPIEVRPITPRDIDAIMAIDQKITGRPSQAFWQSKLASHIERAPSGCLAAESDGRVVGFVLGDIRGWAFMEPLTGWLDFLGVDPDFQGKGVGRRLIAALYEYFRTSGITHVNALIDWNDAELVEYLRSLGFRRGEFVHLHRPMDADPPPP